MRYDAAMADMKQAAEVPESREARKGECNATDGFSVCTEPAGHGPTHWDRYTQQEWSDDERPA
jgi:hypothetical protein